MDAIGPVINVDDKCFYNGEEYIQDPAPMLWSRQENLSGVFWLHQRRRIMFQVFADDTARLVHVCDGREIPDENTQRHYGRNAITLEMVHRGDEIMRLWRPFEALNDAPIWEQSPEEQAKFRQWVAECREAELKWAAEDVPVLRTEADALDEFDPDDVPF